MEEGGLMKKAQRVPLGTVVRVDGDVLEIRVKGEDIGLLLTALEIARVASAEGFTHGYANRTTEWTSRVLAIAEAKAKEVT